VTAVKQKRKYCNFKEDASISTAATERISVKYDFGIYMKIHVSFIVAGDVKSP
jgi:hypothetical protein